MTYFPSIYSCTNNLYSTQYIETWLHRHQQSRKYFDTDSVKNLEARNETDF